MRSYLLSTTALGASLGPAQLRKFLSLIAFADRIGAAAPAWKR